MIWTSMRSAAAIAVAAMVAFASAPQAAAGPLLDGIKQRGTLRCGVQGPSNPGFGVPDAQGQWTGFNVDFCRGIASVIFNDATKFTIVPVTAQNRFAMIQAGQVDILTQNTTATQARDTQLRLNFPAITFYDSQGILVPRRLNVTSARQLNGATICVLPGTTNEQNLADFFRANNQRFTPVVIENRDDLRRTYAEGRCDGYSSDATTLAAQRRLLPVPDDHIVLPDALSKEPLGIAVPHGDEEFRDIVAWTFYTLLNAEELGITQANVEQMAASSTNPEIRRLLGVEPGLGAGMGVNDRYAILLLRTVGNYGEIFERHLGPNTPLALPRGLNRLWTQGGIMYGLPNR